MKNKRLISIVIISLAILLIPLIAMQFTNEVNWTASDFVVAGALLLGTGLLIEFVLRKVKKVNARFLIIIIVLAVLFIIWAELAVGIFGTPFSGS